MVASGHQGSTTVRGGSALNWPFGYTVIKQVNDGRIFNVTEAINAEPRLGPREKALLLSMYRELLRQAKTGDDAAARAKD
jgi:hypothetical protein